MVFEIFMWTILEKNDAGKCQKIEKVDKALEEIFTKGISFLMHFLVNTESFNTLRRSVNFLKIINQNLSKSKSDYYGGLEFLRCMEGGSIIVHVDIGRWSIKCPCLSTLGGWEVKNGQNLVHMVCE